jgi:hypothetical protein
MRKLLKIFFNSVPILIMVGLIPLIQNDYFLALVYIGIIFISLFIKHERNDISVSIFGFFIMITFEYIFINTGVETFTRNSLFGAMPLWLPFLWSYGFIAIKRSVLILNS